MTHEPYGPVARDSFRIDGHDADCATRCALDPCRAMHRCALCDLPPGAEPDDDLDALADELTAEYRAAVARVQDRAAWLPILARQDRTRRLAAYAALHPGAYRPDDAPYADPERMLWIGRAMVPRAIHRPDDGYPAWRVATERRENADHAAHLRRYYRLRELPARADAHRAEGSTETAAYLVAILTGAELPDPEYRQRRLHEHYDDAYGTDDGRWSRLDGRTMADA